MILSTNIAPAGGRLRPSLTHRAEQTLVAAFANDPMTLYFFPHAADRSVGLRRIFRVALRQGSLCGEVEELQGGEAVAIWLRSDRATMNPLKMLRSGIVTAGLGLGWSASRRILGFLRSIEDTRLRSTPNPHWYLLNLAVCPKRQGQGLGSTLLRHGLARAKAEGAPCFLETTNSRNLAFYEKHGFVTIHQGPAPKGGPVVWSMVSPVHQS
jgi:ribosomal protein S18 acetylase RimI-like enzyme